MSERGLAGERVREDLRSPPEPRIEADDVLRDALADLILAESRFAPVLDAEGRVAGILSIEVISHALNVPHEEVAAS